MLIQTFLSFFLLFVLSRVVMQVRQGKLAFGSFLFWTGLFIFALAGVLSPEFTSSVARFFGIGRGTDIVIYLSIALLFYLIFRLSIALEEVRRNITQLVRHIAFLQEQKVRKKRKKRT